MLLRNGKVVESCDIPYVPIHSVADRRDYKIESRASYDPLYNVRFGIDIVMKFFQSLHTLIFLYKK
jgi:hypothetical protein